LIRDVAPAVSAKTSSRESGRWRPVTMREHGSTKGYAFGSCPGTRA
jgi:hypothetical protein